MSSRSSGVPRQAVAGERWTATRGESGLSRSHLFSSESVTEGHPDKIADQVSDAVLDAVLADDPTGRVACETLLTTGVCLIAGEITTSATLDFPKIARDTIEEVGYTDATTLRNLLRRKTGRGIRELRGR